MLHRPVAALGRRTRRLGAAALHLTRFIGAAGRAAVGVPPAARALWLRGARAQVDGAGVDALPFVSLLALLVGASVVAEVKAQGFTSGVASALGRIFATVVVRGLGPLLTALAVVARSGTSISAELATGQVLGEADALDVAGVDLLQYYVVPRVIGAAAAVALLVVFFDTVALVAGIVAARVLGVAAPSSVTAALRGLLHPADVGLALLKGGVLGGGVALLCSYSGLLGGRLPTDIPRAVTRGVVLSLGFVVGVSALFSLAGQG